MARGLGIHPNRLYNWKKKFSSDGEKAFPGKGHLTELSALRKELREVQMERDILKKFEGWLYLAAIMDLFSRGIVGLAMDKTIADTLALSALKQALLRRSPPKGLICHSDRGVQYAGNDFKALLAKNEFIGSMSKKGDCWDNAVAESFSIRLK